MKRFQNRIAESRRLLPFVTVVCSAIWILSGLANDAIWLSFACMLLSTYLMAELNNTNALIRVYSRMVSCTFLVFSTMAMPDLSSPPTTIVILCTTGFYLLAFRCYQDPQANGRAYYAFLFVGIASVFFIQALFFLPILWLLMKTKLMSLSLRSFCASLLGIVTPYWFLSAYYAATGDISALATHFMPIAEFPLPSYILALSSGSPLFSNHSSLLSLITLLFITLMSVTGIIHFLRKSSNDKLRTQMLYETFIVVDIAAFIFLALQPQHYDMLMGIIIVNSSPLVAHYITLTHTRLTNIVTIVAIITALLITAYNIWTH